jgi:hypothetical protein
LIRVVLLRCEWKVSIVEENSNKIDERTLLAAFIRLDLAWAGTWIDDIGISARKAPMCVLMLNDVDDYGFPKASKCVPRDESIPDEKLKRLKTSLLHKGRKRGNNLRLICAKSGRSRKQSPDWLSSEAPSLQ